MSTELTKRSYVSALYKPCWQNKFSPHMHSSCHGQNTSQVVTPVVTGITTENASPKIHIKNLKWSCRNKIRQRLEDALFRIRLQNSPQKHDASMGYLAGSRVGTRRLEPGTPSSLCPIRHGSSKDVVLHVKMWMVGSIAQTGYFFFCLQRKLFGCLLLELVYNQTKEQSFEEKFYLLKDIL